MGWRILVNFIRQSMLKLPTHSGFHDLLLNYTLRVNYNIYNIFQTFCTIR
jgi:hypothetical protein